MTGAAAGGVLGSVEAGVHHAEQEQGFGQGDWILDFGHPKGRRIFDCRESKIPNLQSKIRAGEPPCRVSPLDRIVGDQPSPQSLEEFGAHWVKLTVPPTGSVKLPDS